MLLSFYGFFPQGQITYFPLYEDFRTFQFFSVYVDVIKQAKWRNNCLIVHGPYPKWRWMSVIQRSLGNCSQADQWLPLSEPVFDEFARISISLQITNHFQILKFFIYLSYYESEVRPNCQKRSTRIILLGEISKGSKKLSSVWISKTNTQNPFCEIEGKSIFIFFYVATIIIIITLLSGWMGPGGPLSANLMQLDRLIPLKPK